MIGRIKSVRKGNQSEENQSKKNIIARKTNLCYDSAEYSIRTENDKRSEQKKMMVGGS